MAAVLMYVFMLKHRPLCRVFKFLQLVCILKILLSIFLIKRWMVVKAYDLFYHLEKALHLYDPITNIADQMSNNEGVKACNIMGLNLSSVQWFCSWKERNLHNLFLMSPPCGLNITLQFASLLPSMGCEDYCIQKWGKDMQ